MSEVPPFFNKFEKSVKDLLDSKKFSLDRTVQVKGTNQSGVTFTAKSVLKDSGASGKFKAEYKCKTYGEGSLEFDTKDLVSAEYTSTELVDGLKVVVSTEANKVKGQQECNLDVTAKYTRDKFAGILTFDFVKPSDGSENELADLEVSTKVSTGANNFFVGAEARYANSEVANYLAGVAYRFNDSQVFLKAGEEKGNNLARVGYFQKILPRVDFATQFQLTRKGDEDTEYSYERSASFGLENKLNDTTKVRTMLTKNAGSSLIFSGLFTSTLNANSRLSLASTVDLENLESDNHTFGLKLEFGQF
jgi:hypothetical protein